MHSRIQATKKGREPVGSRAEGEKRLGLYRIWLLLSLSPLPLHPLTWSKARASLRAYIIDVMK
eukprot:scaffold4524_cov126-Skeletonema_dohrnii-CCMP3373.AAC.4